MASDDNEAFSQMNAQPELIAQHFREALLYLMRAVAVKDDNTSALSEAMARWRFMLKGMKDCQEPLNWHTIFKQAVKSFRAIDHVGDEVDEAFREVARTGMSVYIDDIKRGGGGAKFDRFLQAIQDLELARTRRRERVDHMATSRTRRKPIKWSQKPVKWNF
jgi:hypothetical protein